MNACVWIDDDDDDDDDDDACGLRKAGNHPVGSSSRFVIDQEGKCRARTFFTNAFFQESFRSGEL